MITVFLAYLFNNMTTKNLSYVETAGKLAGGAEMGISFLGGIAILLGALGFGAVLFLLARGLRVV